MGTCTGCYGSCDHTACHSSVLLSALVPLPLSCHDSRGDPGIQTSERKTATVTGVWEKNRNKKIWQTELHGGMKKREWYEMEDREKIGREDARERQRGER